ncbi:hypothetical protein RZP17_29700, partial [Klebsiella variicola subsp. variicola]|nr:hypothetical protein [Klebsiella variicola subsp. variicola]
SVPEPAVGLFSPMHHGCCSYYLNSRPFYFERVAILARKNKNYKLEVDIIERYITELEGFYRLNNLPVGSGVMAGPRFSSIVSRLEKSRKLLERNIKSE